MRFWNSRLRSLRYALAGLAHVLRTQQNAWLHLIFTLMAIVAGWAFGIAPQDWLWVASAIAMVWFAETMNTAFEYLCDVVSPDYSEAVKHAKNIAAGAVLISAAYALVVAAVIFSRAAPIP